MAKERYAPDLSQNTRSVRTIQADGMWSKANEGGQATKSGQAVLAAALVVATHLLVRLRRDPIHPGNGLDTAPLGAASPYALCLMP